MYKYMLMYQHRNCEYVRMHVYVRVQNTGARIFKRLWSPKNDSKKLIPPAYVAWRAGKKKTLSLLGS
jgi:hypothetical protein